MKVLQPTNRTEREMIASVSLENSFQLFVTSSASPAAFALSASIFFMPERCEIW